MNGQRRTLHPIRTAGVADRDPIAAMLARAFADDPAMCFIFPDPENRAKRLPRLFRLLYDSDAGHGLREQSRLLPESRLRGGRRL